MEVAVVDWGLAEVADSGSVVGVGRGLAEVADKEEMEAGLGVAAAGWNKQA